MGRSFSSNRVHGKTEIRVVVHRRGTKVIITRGDRGKQPPPHRGREMNDKVF